MNEEMLAWIELDLIHLKSLKKEKRLKAEIIKESEHLIDKGIEKFGKEYSLMSGPQMNEFMHSLEDDNIDKKEYEKIKDLVDQIDGKVVSISSEENRMMIEKYKSVFPFVNEDYIKVIEILSTAKNIENLQDFDDLLETELAPLITKRCITEFGLDSEKMNIYMELLKICIQKGSPFTEEEIDSMRIIGKLVD